MISHKVIHMDIGDRLFIKFLCFNPHKMMSSDTLCQNYSFKNLVEEYDRFLEMVDLLDLDEIPFPCQNRVKQKM